MIGSLGMGSALLRFCRDSLARSASAERPRAVDSAGIWPYLASLVALFVGGLVVHAFTKIRTRDANQMSAAARAL